MAHFEWCRRKYKTLLLGSKPTPQDTPDTVRRLHYSTFVVARNIEENDVESVVKGLGIDIQCHPCLPCMVSTVRDAHQPTQSIRSDAPGFLDAHNWVRDCVEGVLSLTCSHYAMWIFSKVHHPHDHCMLDTDAPHTRLVLLTAA